MQILIIHPYLKQKLHQHYYNLDDKIAEAYKLAVSIDLEVFEVIKVSLSQITPATYIGQGKVAEIKDIVSQNQIGLVIFNDILSPVQQRNLEKKLNTKVIDRTALILEIFGARARTKEGSLQVELALQEYHKSRLIRSWTHLERQRGGSGFLGGPGEKQIESDRRAIDEKILKIKRQLEKVVKTRGLHRKARKRVPYPVVTLVGYTNAGKSTLFNYLTNAGVLAVDKLFATLDPTMRLITLPTGRKIILSDTVGFISDLPTELVAAFRATLEEVIEADLLLHVRDIIHPASKDQKDDVNKILTSLVGEIKLNEGVIEILNKVDLLVDKTENFGEIAGPYVAISAKTGENVNNLLLKIDEYLAKKDQVKTIKVPLSNGELLAWLYNNSNVIERINGKDKITIKCLMSEKNLGVYKKRFLKK